MSENTAYDASAPEGATSPGAQYLTKKDAKWIIGAIVLILIGLTPVYFYMRGKAYKSTCTKNLGNIMKALTAYASDNDDRLPPVYYDNGAGQPVVKDGIPITWVSIISAYKSDRTSFVCPSALEDEYSYSLNLTGGPNIPSTYGMYIAYGTQILNEIDNPGSVILIAETTNHGSQNTFDPVPFTTTTQDGFAIGWDNGNTVPSEETKTITRLAFPGSKGANYSTATGRHEALIHALTAIGGKINLKSEDMATEYSPASYTLLGRWKEPILLKKQGR